MRAFAAYELGTRTGDAKDAVPDLLTGLNEPKDGVHDIEAPERFVAYGFETARCCLVAATAFRCCTQYRVDPIRFVVGRAEPRGGWDDRVS